MGVKDMSCKCGPNCLRRLGRRNECYSCGKARRNNSGNGAGGPRPMIINGAGKRIYAFGGNLSPVAKAAGREAGYAGGQLGVFMQGAGAYKRGGAEPLNDTPHRAGWLWARSAGVHAGDTVEEALLIMEYSGEAAAQFESGAGKYAAGVGRDWRSGEHRGIPYREGWEWAARKHRFMMDEGRGAEFVLGQGHEHD